MVILVPDETVLLMFTKFMKLGVVGAAGVGLILAQQNVNGQRDTVIPAVGGVTKPPISSNQYWGCLGYCNGPLRSTNNQYWGCLGYCNAPLNSNNDVYVPTQETATPFTPMFAAAAAAGSNAKFLFPFGDLMNKMATMQAPPPPEPDPVEVARLTKQLADENNKLRVQAAAELAKRKAKAAVKPLMSMLRDPDPVVRTSAAAALAHLGKDVVGDVTQGLYAEDRMTRMGSAMTLGMIGEPAKTAITALKGSLIDTDVKVRGHAAQAIYRISKDAKTALPVLLKCMQDEDEHVRVGVINALAMMGADAKPAEPELKARLTDTVPLIQIKAAEALLEITKDPKGLAPLLIPVLEKLAGNEDAGIRAEVVALIGQLGIHDAKAVELLQIASRDKDSNVGQIALSALYHAGDPAVPSLIKGLTDLNVQVRFRSVTALAQMGPKAEKAIPALINALNDSDISIRWEAALALGKMKRLAKPAVEKLIDALEDPAYQVRLMAAEALGEIGPDAKAALDALKKAQNDKRGEVVDAARLAIKTISK